MKTSLKVGLLALVGVVLVVAVVLHFWLGSLIKTGVEQVGPKVTRTPVTLDKVDIGLLAGRAQLEGLAVGNAQGFQAPSALKVRTVRARIKWRSLLSNQVVIEEITIEGPEVTYEGILSKSNFSTILDNVQAFSSAAPKPKPGGPPAEPARSAERKFLIKELNLTNGHVAVWASTGVAGSQNLSVGLPDNHLKDIGKDAGGATLSEALSAVFGALNKASTQAVAGTGMPGSKAAGESVGQAASKSAESVKGLFK
ncbi:MAG: AsmA family protein [Nitrospiraceae bacterium]